MTKVETKIVDSHILIIRLNRPDVRNAIDGETAAALDEAWTTFRDTHDLRVAIVTGTGEHAFCAGADLGAVHTLGPGPDASPGERRRFALHGRGYIGYSRQVDIDKPILAAINGDALAGGLELACMADMRIVERHARFGVTCRKRGVPLVDGGTQRLPRLIGLSRAMDLILTGRFVDADEALQIGLANRVVETGQSLDAALDIARELCEVPQTAMRTDKTAAILGFGMSLEEGLRLEALLGQYALADPDLFEGALAFKQKRPPKFQHLD
ncbi:MAG: enoyl-CoA hydratase [Candidatus Dadabacteria bacterium]|nr:MAG: enoyl-CoA hydratase [Candidatus Dadabacteria bacterium]